MLKKVLKRIAKKSAESAQIGREINATMKSMFKAKIVTNVAYKAKKLSLCFNIKDKSPLMPYTQA